MSIQQAELPINQNGTVYHIGIPAQYLADKIILVGDPDRIDLVSDLFDQIEFQHHNREFKSITGYFKEKRLTILSTGIGTDNIDIVINELDTLANFNFETKTFNSLPKQLEIIRIGTCGIFNQNISVFSKILTDYSIGLDQIPAYYSIEFTASEKELITLFQNKLNLPSSFHPYAVQASERLNQKLQHIQTHTGITMTGVGFYGPQGRALRIPLAQENFISDLINLSLNELPITNFEMESSALLSLGKALGHECSCICLGIANRSTGKFASSYEVEMHQLVREVMESI